MALIGPHWTAPWIGGWVGTTTPPVDNWFGVAAVLLAFLGLASKGLPKGVRTLLLLGGVGAEATVLGTPPLLTQIVSSLPAFGQIALWAYAGMWVSFSVAMLAGAGLNALMSRELRWHTLLGRPLLLATAMLALGQIMLTGAKSDPGQLYITAFAFVFVVLFAFVSKLKYRVTNRLATTLIAGALAAELVLLAQPAKPLPVRYDPLTATPVTAFLRTALAPGSARTYSPDGILYPTTNRVFGVEDIRNLDAVYVDRVVRFLQAFVAPGFYDRLDGIGPQKASYNQNPFFDFLNVRYLMVGPPLLGSTVAPAANQYQLVTTTSDGVSIYQNNDFAPRAQVFFNALQSNSESQSIREMQGASFNPRQEAVVETSQALPMGALPPQAAQMVGYTDQSLTINTDTYASGVLVVADTFYPGWVATIDGVPTTIYPADVAFRGVVVPAGSHTIRMEYRPNSVLLGALGIPAAVLLFALFAWIIPWRRNRQRH
jgi:hypothetical protein